MAKGESDVPGKQWSVPVSADFDSRVRERMRAGGFNSIAEYVRGLARTDLAEARNRKLEELLLEGLEGEDVEMTSTDWNEIRETVREQLATRKGNGSKSS